MPTAAKRASIPKERRTLQDCTSRWRGVRRTAADAKCLGLAAILVALALPEAATRVHAQPAAGAPVDLSGRWGSTRLGTVIDVSRCGADWCGARVEKDGQCGRLILRLSPLSDQPLLPSAYSGTLDLSPASQKYRVTAQPVPTGSRRPDVLVFSGTAQIRGTPTVRVMPLNLELARSGDALCKTEAGTT
jgi:hypothetical protein